MTKIFLDFRVYCALNVIWRKIATSIEYLKVNVIVKMEK